MKMKWEETYPFVNMPLPYAYEALEPYIDEKTMRLHHDKHLQTYIDQLNRALSNYTDLQNWTLKQLLENLFMIPKEIRTVVKNNAGGVFNHQFYFDGMKNPSAVIEQGLLKGAIERQFDSMSYFKDLWKETALSVFGSGYTRLVVDRTGNLQIITTANQDTPVTLGLCPVLTIDVWEHAYYLKHYNVRADYIENWFAVLNWERAEENYQDCFGIK